MSTQQITLLIATLFALNYPSCTISMNSPQLPASRPEQDTNEIHEAVTDNDVNSLLSLLNARYEDIKDKLNGWDEHGNTPLILAIKQEIPNIVIIKTLLEHRAIDPDKAHQTEELTPIHYAVERRNLEIINLLVKKVTKSINSYNKRGETPLISAINSAIVSAVEQKATLTTILPDINFENSLIKALLTNKSIDPNKAHQTEALTPIYYAVAGGSPALVDILLSNRANPNFCDTLGLTPLLMAVRSKDEAMIDTLLFYDDTDADFIGEKSDHTPLQAAILQTSTILAEKLLKNRANPNNTGNDRQKNTPLHYAAQAGDDGLTTLLLTYKAEINAVNTEGMTPLHTAVMYGRKRVSDLLLSNGADTSILDTNGATAFQRAVKKGNYDFLKFIIERNKQLYLENIDKTGQTALHYALDQMILNEAFYNIAILLIDSGASVATADTKGNTPLHYALKSNNDTIIKKIIEKSTKEDINKLNAQGESPLAVALQHTFKKTIIESLIEKGAEIDQMSQDGKTPLHYAVLAPLDYRKELVTLLLENKANPNTPGEPPLSYAIKKSDYDTAELLLKYGADAKHYWQQADKKYVTPLDSALSEHKPECSMEKIIRLLICWGAYLGNSQTITSVTQILTDQQPTTYWSLFQSFYSSSTSSSLDLNQQAEAALLTNDNETFKKKIRSLYEAATDKASQYAILSDRQLFLMAVGQGNIAVIDFLLSQEMRDIVPQASLHQATEILTNSIKNSQKHPSWLSRTDTTPTYEKILTMVKQAIKPESALPALYKKILQSIQKKDSVTLKMTLNAARTSHNDYSTFTTLIGDTPLHYALRDAPDLSVVLLLLAHGARKSLFHKNNEGMTPFHYALLSLHELHKKNLADIDKLYDKQEWNAPQLVAECVRQLKELRDIVVALLQDDDYLTNSILNITNNDGVTPLSLIEIYKDDFILNELKRRHINRCSAGPKEFSHRAIQNHLNLRPEVFQYVINQLFPDYELNVVIPAVSTQPESSIEIISQVEQYAHYQELPRNPNTPPSFNEDQNQRYSYNAVIPHVISPAQERLRAMEPEEQKFYQALDFLSIPPNDQDFYTSLETLYVNLEEQGFYEALEKDKQIALLNHHIEKTVNPTEQESYKFLEKEEKVSRLLKRYNEQKKADFLNNDEREFYKLLEHLYIKPKEQAFYKALEENKKTTLLNRYIEKTIAESLNIIDLNTFTHRGDLPLIVVIKAGRKDLVKMFLKKRDLAITKENEFGTTAIHEATAQPTGEILEQLLRQSVDTNIRNKYGKTPAHLAASTGNIITLARLIDYESNINIPDYEGDTPLHRAAKNNHESIISLLLAHKASINTVNYKQKTPLHIAAEENHNKILDTLLFNGANPDLQDSLGNTALHYAVNQRNLEACISLLTHHARTNITNNQEETALFWAVHRKPKKTATRTQETDKKILTLLLKYESPTNSINLNQETPLIRAILGKNTASINMLLTHNADPNQSGITKSALAHAIALKKDRLPIVRLLLTFGANFSTLSFEEKRQYTDHLLAELGSEKNTNKRLSLEAEHALITKNRERFKEIIKQNPKLLTAGLLFYLAVGTGRHNTVPFLLRTCKSYITSEILHNTLNIAQILAQRQPLNRYRYETIANHIRSVLYQDPDIAVQVPPVTFLPTAIFAGTSSDYERALSTLFTGVYENNIKLIQDGISAGASILDQNQHGETPLHVALKKENPSLPTILVLLAQLLPDYPKTSRIHINTPSKSGYSPLHYAVNNIAPHNVRLKQVLDNKQSTNQEIKAALERMTENEAILRSLLEAGANPLLQNLRYEEVHTPFSRAESHNDPLTLEVLNEFRLTAEQEDAQMDGFTLLGEERPIIQPNTSLSSSSIFIGGASNSAVFDSFINTPRKNLETQNNSADQLSQADLFSFANTPEPLVSLNNSTMRELVTIQDQVQEVLKQENPVISLTEDHLSQT